MKRQQRERIGRRVQQWAVGLGLLALVGCPGQPPEQSISEAIRAGDYDEVKRLLNVVGGNVSANTTDDEGTPLLLIALRQGQFRMVDLLLSEGADPNLGDANGVRPLRFAVFEGDVELAKALIDQGANPNMPDGSGTPPLQWAVVFRQAEMIDLLLREGASLRPWDPGESVTASGMTAVHQAVLTRDAEVLDQLLGWVPNPDTLRDRRGNTPLMLAAFQGHGDAVDQLLEAGADPTVTNEQGKTAIDFAIEAGHFVVAARLEAVVDGEQAQTPRPNQPAAGPGGA